MTNIYHGYSSSNSYNIIELQQKPIRLGFQFWPISTSSIFPKHGKVDVEGPNNIPYVVETGAFDDFLIK